MMNSTVGIAASLLSGAEQTEVSIVHLFLVHLLLFPHVGPGKVGK